MKPLCGLMFCVDCLALFDDFDDVDDFPHGFK